MKFQFLLKVVIELASALTTKALCLITNVELRLPAGWQELRMALRPLRLPAGRQEKSL